jgi:hypothetical protein
MGQPTHQSPPDVLDFNHNIGISGAQRLKNPIILSSSKCLVYQKSI